MATKYLDNTGLAYFWGKIKAWGNSVFAPIAHTHTSYAVKHSYTVAANAAKNWYRIANASTQQLDASKPIHAQFILTAYNASYSASYYERWFVNAEVFGRTAQIAILGNTNAPFTQARILYENTIADLDANDRPAIDIYLNYQLANGTTKIEIEEVYSNGGWTFVADGQLAASTVPSGFESAACGVRNNGIERSTYADYVSYLSRQISNITDAFTLADNYLYRSRTLNCTGTFTITIPSIDSGYMWCVIKNKNTSSGVITLHPSTTSVLIDGSNADITLQPMEYVCIHSAGANSYSLIADGRWKSQKADDFSAVHKTGNESISGRKTFTGDAFFQGNVYGISKDDSEEDANDLYATAAGACKKYYTTSISKTKLSNIPAATNTTLESYTVRYISASDWTVHQILHNINALYYRVGTSTNGGTWTDWRAFAFTDSDISGNAATATKLATPVTINGVSFDGSANITVADSTKVSKSGDTMTGDLTISKTSPHLITKNTSITRGAAPSSDVAVTEILGRDSAEKATWALYHTYTTNKTHRIHLLCYNGLTTDNQYAEIGVGYDSNGNPFTNAPTPAAGDNSTKIATTAFVKTKCDGYLPLSGGTLTGALNGRASNVNLSVEPASWKEDWRFSITKSSADTTHTGNLMRLGVIQLANSKDYRIMLTVANPRAGNLPTQESIAGGEDDSDARTSNNWGGIGVYYDYSKNKAYPYCYDLTTCDLSDNSTQRLATNYWVRNATGNFACNAATASAFASSKPVTLTGAVTGTASSTGGWSVSTVWRSCIVGRTNSGTSNPWYKVASRKLNGGSSAYNITFYVENANTASKFSGILRASVGTNGDKTINAGVTKFAWLVNDGFAEEDFVLVCPATAEPTVELWTRVAAGYLRRRFVVISEGGATSTGLLWTLFDAVSAGQAASISTEGTQIVSTAGGYVSNAASASTVPWSGVAGKPSTFTPSSHNQASNTIDAMTGYSKPSSTSAIAATDSLNAAVGKLEKENEYLRSEILLVNAAAANGAAVTSANKLLMYELEERIAALEALHA